MANPTFETMEDRLDRLERTLTDVSTKVDSLSGRLSVIDDRMGRVEERMYGVEDRMDAMGIKLDVSVESLRSDFKLAFDRIDGLREFMERSREEDRRDRAADRGVFEAILRDHNRRLRAIERLERRRSGSAP